MSAARPALPALRRWMTRTIAAQAELAPVDVDVTAPFSDFGVDSVFVLSWCADLEDEFGVDLDPSEVWNYPSIEELARYLASGSPA